MQHLDNTTIIDLTGASSLDLDKLRSYLTSKGYTYSDGVAKLLKVTSHNDCLYVSFRDEWLVSDLGWSRSIYSNHKIIHYSELWPKAQWKL